MKGGGGLRPALFTMTNQEMTNAQTVLQLMSLLAIAMPICAYCAYWVWITDQAKPESNGRQRYWNMLYAAVAAFVLLGFFA